MKFKRSGRLIVKDLLLCLRIIGNSSTVVGQWLQLQTLDLEDLS